MDRNLIFFSPYHNPNLVENLQSQIMITSSPELHGNPVIPVADPCDLYRYEDGGGDARALLLGEEESQSPASYSSPAEVQMKMIMEMGRNVSVVNPVLHSPAADGAASGQSRSFGRLPYLNLVQRATCCCPFILIGHEQYALQPDTIFVLGMRQSITKNDIIVCFGKIGHIKVDEGTNKPKIFVYKDKLTGRSKGEATITYVSPLSAQAAIAAMSGRRFMGHTLTVLPAYLSTRSGTVRYGYPRSTRAAEQQQLEPRPQKWKPASDNWSCLVCRNSNFVWRSSCNRCQADKGTPAPGVSNSDRRRRPHTNDWLCDSCYNINFWYRKRCNLCNSEKAESKEEGEAESQCNGDSTLEKEKWELVLQSSAEDLLSSCPGPIDDVSIDV